MLTNLVPLMMIPNREIGHGSSARFSIGDKLSEWLSPDAPLKGHFSTKRINRQLTSPGGHSSSSYLCYVDTASAEPNGAGSRLAAASQ